MNTLTRFAHEMLGNLRGQPVTGEPLGELPLPVAEPASPMRCCHTT